MTRPALSWAGLASGPIAWAVSTQGNYLLPTWQCVKGSYPVPWVAFILVLVALAGGWFSFSTFQAVLAGPSALPRKPRSERLLSLLGIAVAIICALGIALQGFAGFVFTGCER